MRIEASRGRDDIATVYIAEMENGKLIEFVESVQPPIPRRDKWVLIVSTLFGCPVGCPICDAGSEYSGKLTKGEIFAQIDYLVRSRFPDGRVPIPKFKVQFARMGEPALNDAVLDVLEELPDRYDAPGLIPCISTVAPSGSDAFFDRLLTIKERRYRNGRFQLQFSIHSTDESARNGLIPVRKWNLCEIPTYGERWHRSGDRKISLNFALADGVPLDGQKLRSIFSPEHFLVKITPVNPTYNSVKNGISSAIGSAGSSPNIARELISLGYDVIVSIGELEENQIGSNCGQYVMKYRKGERTLGNSYTYWSRE